MAREIIGLKVGASQLAAARVAQNGSAQLLQTAQEPLPAGVVQAGEVRDIPALALALKQFFAHHKLPRRAVRVGIANNRIGVRTIEIDGVADPRQLANAVLFRAQEALPIPIADAVLDYQVLAEARDAEGHPRQKVLLVVAYRDLVDSLAAACRQAGLRLIGVDLEAFALLRSLRNPAEALPESGERSALVAVTIGAERTTLAVSEGLTCEYTRVLDWGGRSLTAVLARALEIELPAAEALKRQLSLDGETGGGELSPEQAARAGQALELGLQTGARELVSSLQFYQSQPASLGIREVVLAGGTAKLGGLAAALQRLLGVAVRVGDPAAGVDVRRLALESANDPALAVPIGLGMGR